MPMSAPAERTLRAALANSSSANELVTRINNSTIELGETAAVINETGADTDFRVESDANANAFFLDAGLFSGVGAIGVGAVGVNTAAFTIDPPATTAVATVSYSKARIDNSAAVTVPTGTTALVTSLHVGEPNITATGTVTNAATVYIEAAPTEGGTGNYALWVDAGTTRLDGTVLLDTLQGNTGTTGTFSLALTDNLADAFSVKEASTSYLTFVTTDSSESIAAGKRLTTTDGVASGTARVVGGGAYRSVAASTAITGATETETNFDTNYTMPAATLKAGTRVRIRAQGIHTATTGSEDHTILLKLGSVTLASFAAVDPANNDVFYFDFEFVCRTAGASGTIVGCGTAGAVTPTTGTAKVVALASTTVDTTAANVVAVAIDRQSTATDSDSARLDYLTVDVIG